MTDLNLPPRLDPGRIEPRIYRRWLDGGYFRMTAERAREQGTEPFVVVIPPPNVTAVLHMGHGLNNTIQDVLVRWRRMQGRAALWVPGTDHAGIATQNVVERQLAAEGKTRHDLGREAFLARTWEWIDRTGGLILEQLRAIGCSCDWERTRFTLEPALSKAVRTVFVRLFDKGLVYRGEYIVNWCPRCLTALSNEEAEGHEIEGTLYDLRYPLEEAAWDRAAEACDLGGSLDRADDGSWYLTVSTTRPETMLGDTAVAVNPRDERYAGLIGAHAVLPLAGRRIPIVGDDFVDRDFGTGMVKVTPAHDINDFEISRRTGAPLLNILTRDARLNENVPPAFRGMSREEARGAVLKALAAAGLAAGSKPHPHTVPRCYRCDTVVEPRLSKQWFVRMEPLAEPALQASRDGVVTFVPGRRRNDYEKWMENIRDWCVSRQLWWGHRIPVWYCGCGNIFAAMEDPDACPTCGSGDLEQDPDVLDTWFSSWLWPFSVFGWPEESEDLDVFYPGHVLSTAPEILFFWVARMIMSGFEVMGETPFTQVYLHGTVRDISGHKMSKSRGNGIDPLEVVRRFGADALRYTMVAECGVGADIRLDHTDLEASFAPGRNFANKLWNAGRFTLANLGDEPAPRPADVEEDLELADRWMLSRLSNSCREVTQALEAFRLHEAAERLRQLFWGEFADWYLEVIKPRLRGDAGEASRTAARATLARAFDTILRLLHPVVPFVTEALWERLRLPGGAERPPALMVAPWPEAQPRWEAPAVEREMAALQELITGIRRLRKEYGVGEGRRVKVVLTSVPPGFTETLAAGEEAIARLARVEAVTLDGRPRGVGAHAVLKNGAEVFVPLEDVIDLDRERERLRREVARLGGQINGARRKLANRNFLERAPERVVAHERDKLASFRQQHDKLQEKLAALADR
ncbi:MAG: valine--tRNA ligase [Gammaproteobacteria bacterium]|nr:valine--tRNA ligase [Gammaproteobacteria bacterium]